MDSFGISRILLCWTSIKTALQSVGTCHRRHLWLWEWPVGSFVTTASKRMSFWDSWGSQLSFVLLSVGAWAQACLRERIGDVEGPANEQRMHIFPQPLRQAGQMHVASHCAMWPLINISDALHDTAGLRPSADFCGNFFCLKPLVPGLKGQV